MILEPSDEFGFEFNRIDVRHLEVDVMPAIHEVNVIYFDTSFYNVRLYHEPTVPRSRDRNAGAL